MTTQCREDHALLAGWRDGSARAGRALLAVHGDALTRFFATKLGDPAHVAGLVQRTLLRAQTLAPAPGLGVRATLFSHARAELRRLAERTLAATGRRGQPRPRVDPDVLTAADLDPSHRPTAPVEQALRGLCLDDQILLEWTYWEDLTFVELAAIFEVPAAAVVDRLRRARARFAARLDVLTAPRRRAAPVTLLEIAP